jgi:pyruvate/2-oxoglutarate dehydrogenase complex dihydrolipoamide dehydrogenase (E3) component/uncharacterized membrane protein YdjX (TVP38/TMEM64 family)
MKYTHHTIVIGAWSGGLTVALGLASTGKKVLMIERGLIGWDCTNYGCVPSKTLIHADGDIAESLSSARHIRDEFRDEETRENFESKYPHLTIVEWSASFINTHTIQVSGVEYSAKNIVIATGSDPRIMEIEWVPVDRILTNRTIFDVENIEKLVIVGWGFIAIEMALAFARRDVGVTMLVRSDRLGSGVDDEFTASMRSTLESAWVDIRYNTSIEKGDEKELILKSSEQKSGFLPSQEWQKETKYGLFPASQWQEQTQSIPYSHILLALGRVANTEWLDLEKVGIKSDKWGIITDSYGRTSVKNIFALGDVVSGNRQFTHLANHEGRGIIQSLLVPFWKKKIKPTNVPSVLYDREVEFARTGLTFEEATEKYWVDSIVLDRMDFSANDRSRTESDTTGYVRIIAKRLSLQIVGAEIVGRNAWEMISILTLSIDRYVSLYKLRTIIVPYPTRSDLIKRLADRMVISTLRSIKSDVSWWIGKRIPLLIGLLIWGSLIWTFLYYKNMSGKDNLMLIKDLYNIITGTIYGPLIYIIFYAVRPLIFFPATLLTFLSGLLFWVGWGFVYTMIGENMSASVAYLTGRFFGTHIPELRRSPITLDSERTFSSILFTRFAFFPFDIVNYLSGFLRLPWLPFALATLIGIIPGALVFIIAGASIQGIEDFSLSGIRIDSSTLLASACIFIVSILFARYLKNRKK